VSSAPRIAEYVEPGEEHLIRLLVQVGVTEAVSVLPWAVGAATSSTATAFAKTDDPWSAAALERHAQYFGERGLRLTVIEDSPPMEQIRLGAPGRDRELEMMLELVRALGSAGVDVLCLNFMAGSGWARTATAVRGRGGALVTAFESSAMRRIPPARFAPLERSRVLESFAWFVERIRPAAESAGVRIAFHPDDPPVPSFRGVARVLASLDDLEAAVRAAASPNVGLAFCQGNIALMTPDVPAAIRRFAELGSIHFVHFRDVTGGPDAFVETFHDEGPTDMHACMRAYAECAVDVPMRCDHVPTLDGDDHSRPGYSVLGRLWAVGYMQGLREAALGSPSGRP